MCLWASSTSLTSKLRADVVEDATAILNFVLKYLEQTSYLSYYIIIRE